MPFVLGIELKNTTPIPVGPDRNRARRWIRDVQKETLLEVAAFWHRVILPTHAEGGAAAEYHYEPRRPFYLNITKKFEGRGKGRRPDVLNFLTGQSMRWMMAAPRIRSASSKQVFLQLRPPRYFTNPFVGTINRGGKSKHITRQPDKPAEITTVSRRDSERMRTFGRRAMGRIVRRMPPPEVVKL